MAGTLTSTRVFECLTSESRCRSEPLELLGHHDHALSGEWKDCRDCHVKPDRPVLIYQKPDADTLRLVRLGSHSELGL